MKQAQGLLLILVALILAYPAFLFGKHLGDSVVGIPQDLSINSWTLILSFALNFLIVAAVMWATCYRKRVDSPQRTAATTN